MVYNNLLKEKPIFVLNNVILEQVDVFPYLGLSLDPQLKFITHRKNTVNNIRHEIVQLGRVRNYVEEDTALDVYKTMVLPTLDYADYVWDRDNKGENQDLQFLQNIALRIVYKVKLEKKPRLKIR